MENNQLPGGRRKSTSHQATSHFTILYFTVELKEVFYSHFIIRISSHVIYAE